MLALTLHAVKIERNLPFRFDNGVFDKHTKQTTTTMMTTTTKTKEIIPFIRPFLFDFGWPMPIERWWRWDERQIHTLSMRAYLDEESIFFSFFLSHTLSLLRPLLLLLLCSFLMILYNIYMCVFASKPAPIVKMNQYIEHVCAWARIHRHAVACGRIIYAISSLCIYIW